jgi:SAM-dependent methyltransferase
MWNREFSAGRWDHLDATPGDCVYPFVEKYANGGSILDLGCGSGNTANELAASSYRDYTGVDVSDVAIDKAIKRTEENGRAHQNRFSQSDILTYVPTQKFDVILFRESIYYFRPSKIKPMLDRYASYLKNGGVFIVRMLEWTGKFQSLRELIEVNFGVLERHFSDEPRAMVVVFQARSSSERPA